MPDVLIRHCTLRIVRRGGWSWGPDPAALVQDVINRIGELLERKLAEFWDHDEDIEITGLVRIRVPVRLRELLDQRSDQHSRSGLPETSLDERLERAVDAALAPFLALRSIPPMASESEETSESAQPAEPVRREAGGQSRTALQRLLSFWRDRDILAATLASFSSQALEAWHNHLLTRQAGSFPDIGKQTPESIAALILTIAEEAREYTFPLNEEAGDRAALIRLRLFVAVEVAAYLGVEPHHPALLGALDQGLPPWADPKVEVKEQGESGGLWVTAPSTSVAPSTHRPWRGEFSVSTALPFLLLGPLSRVGYLDALAAILEAAGISQAAPLFAQALAYKVLAPPERGWRRGPAEVSAATVFAGLADPTGSSELADFAGQIAPHLSPLDAVLRESLVEGHNLDSPLLIHEVGTSREEAAGKEKAGGGGLLLLDTEGIFPIAWAADLDGLMPALARFHEIPLLVPLAAIEAVPLGRLHAGGFHFITDAPPLRHEPWRALRQPPAHRFWTNDGTSSEHRLIALASSLATTEEEAAVLWEALAVRPSIPLMSDQALDRSLGLAAAAALGTIAWMLWRKREPVTPLLAIDRFDDLDAWITVDADIVRVRLPLGRRSQDLSEHGFLDDVPDVPWLGGRLLQFSRG